MKNQFLILAITAIALLFNTNSLHSQNSWPGTIYFTNGTTVEAKVYPPQANVNEIKWKGDKKVARIKSYNGNEVDSISLDENGSKVIYKKITVERKVGRKGKTIKYLYWVKALVEGEVTLYEGYDVSEVSTSNTPNAPMRSSTLYSYYCQRKSKESATFIGQTRLDTGVYGEKRGFLKSANEFFSDCPELADKLGKKGYKIHDVKEVVESYNGCISE